MWIRPRGRGPTTTRREGTSSMADELLPRASLLSPAEAPESVIAGLSKLGVWSLWVPGAVPIPPSSVEWLAVPGLVLAVWHLRAGVGRASAVRARGRAFGFGAA